MTEPKNPVESIGEVLKRGLSFVNGGVGQVADVINSADSSLRTLDTSLTGRPAVQTPNPVSAAPPGSMDPTQATTQAVDLIRRGQQAAQQTGSMTSPSVTDPFKQLVTMLFNPSLALPSPDSLQGLMPTPAQALQFGLQDLRGSMAVFRLANGSGTPADLVGVVGFAETLMGRLNSAASLAPSLSTSPSPAPAPPNPQEEEKKPARRGRTKRQPPDESTAALAKAVAEELDDAGLRKSAQSFSTGRLAEATFQKRVSKVADDKGREVEDVMNRAVEREADAAQAG